MVIQRGPSQWAATIGWDLKKDAFKIGQWFHGRIYALRCDLSPDGRHLLYFAASRKHPGDDPRNSWTALSRAPYLHALDLYFNGNSYFGGGLFVDDRQGWLNFPTFRPYLILQGRRTSHVKYTRINPFCDGFCGSECQGVYFPRLERDGWVFSPENSGEECACFIKKLPKGWLLYKLFHSGGRRDRQIYWESHRLIHPEKGVCREYSDWEWAEFDAPRKRILFAEAGCLFSLSTGNMDAEPKYLYDFSEMKRENLQAPYSVGPDSIPPRDLSDGKLPF